MVEAELKALVDSIEGFSRWNHAEKIRFFAWFQHSFKHKDSFATSEISACFDALHYDKPNISQFLSDMEKRKPKVLLRTGNVYSLEGSVREDYDRKYGVHEITLNIRQKVRDLVDAVPDVAEKDFMKEAEICLRHDAGRATIIMVWNVAFYHLCQYILKDKLAEFNSGYQSHYKGKWRQAKVQVIRTYDDFSVDLKESEVIDICKRQQVINQNVAKILVEKLNKRNSAAHPSTIHISQVQAEAFIDDLVSNVVLALNV